MNFDTKAANMYTANDPRLAYPHKAKPHENISKWPLINLVYFIL